MLSRSVSSISSEFEKINSKSPISNLGYKTNMISEISTVDISQISPVRQESGYESCTFEDVSLDEVKINNTESYNDDVLRKNATFYGYMSTIPQNIYLLFSYIYFIFVSTIFKVVRKITR
uniref:Uncharacterized protein n=1 Tax=Strongyloides venezuelensis TaxID=75913 RepID=A0A0K0F8Q1_STRVS